jgi:hypothetical protein
VVVLRAASFADNQFSNALVQPADLLVLLLDVHPMLAGPEMRDVGHIRPAPTAPALRRVLVWERGRGWRLQVLLGLSPQAGQRLRVVPANALTIKAPKKGR